MGDIEKSLLIDLVNGRVGTIVDKKPNGDRVDIQFKPLNAILDKQWIFNVPVLGLKQIDMTKVRTPYDWYLLVNDGSDKSSPILEALNIHMTESITGAEETRKTSGLMDSVASTREKLANVQGIEKAKELIELANISRKKRDIEIPINIGED